LIRNRRPYDSSRPAWGFHTVTDRLLKYLLPEICVTRIGLAENRRRGMKIVFRHKEFQLLRKFFVPRKKGGEAAWVEPEPLPGVCPRSDYILRRLQPEKVA
jgi:hypothetical protein